VGPRAGPPTNGRPRAGCGRLGFFTVQGRTEGSGENEALVVQERKQDPAPSYKVRMVQPRCPQATGGVPRGRVTRRFSALCRICCAPRMAHRRSLSVPGPSRSPAWVPNRMIAGPRGPAAHGRGAPAPPTKPGGASRAHFDNAQVPRENPRRAKEGPQAIVNDTTRWWIADMLTRCGTPKLGVIPHDH